MVLRPALHLYSTVGPEFAPIGLAWLNDESAHRSIRDATINATAGLALSTEPDPSCLPMYTAGRARDAPPYEEGAIKEMRKMLEMIGREPDGTENLLPPDPAQRGIALKARGIRKVAIVFLTGPLEISNRSKNWDGEIVSSYHQARVLSGCASQSGRLDHRCRENMANAIPERFGVWELELFAFDRLPDLQVKEILLR